MRTRLGWIGLALLATLSGSQLLAQGPGGGDRRRGPRMIAGTVEAITAAELTLKTMGRPPAEGKPPTTQNLKVALASDTRYGNIATGTKAQLVVGVLAAAGYKGTGNSGTARAVGVYKKATVAQGGALLQALSMSVRFRSWQEGDERGSVTVVTGTVTKVNPLTIKTADNKVITLSTGSATKYLKATDIQRSAVKKGQFATVTPKGQPKEGQKVTAALVITMPAPERRGRPGGQGGAKR